MRRTDVLVSRQSAAEGRVVPDFFNLPSTAVCVAVELEDSEAASTVVTANGISGGVAATEALTFTTDETQRGFVEFSSIDLFTITTGVDGNPAGWITVTMLNVDGEPLYYEKEVESRLMCRLATPSEGREVVSPGVENVRATRLDLFCKPTGDIEANDMLYLEGVLTYEVLTAETPPGMFRTYYRRARLRTLI